MFVYITPFPTHFLIQVTQDTPNKFDIWLRFLFRRNSRIMGILKKLYNRNFGHFWSLMMMV